MRHLRSSVGSLLIIAIVGSAVVSTGCTSMKPIAITPAPGTGAFGGIRPGDTVVVEMKGGRRDRFKVARIDGEALVSPEGERYERVDMKQLKQQKFSHLKTWPLVGGIVLATLAVLAAIAFGGSTLGYPE